MRKGADDNLESFAKRIESRIREGLSGSDSMERLICRQLVSKKNPQVSAGLAHKWVEWRYGKATENVHVTGNMEHTHIDTSKFTDEQLAQIENLVESAVPRSDPG